VLGVGLNVSTEAFPAELAESATSLYLSGIEGGVEAVLRNVLSSLDRWLGAPPARVLEAWRSRDALKGERVRWTGGDGVANGIDDSGALVVETSGGLVTLDAGEVHLRR
jgi:BirA family transcriptional regulator, biotin operon repressor / biotin---[acetyl-CoA-carboxylase] ligase